MGNAYPWWAGGMAIAAALIDADGENNRTQLAPETDKDNGQSLEQELQRFEGEGGPPAPETNIAVI